MKIKALLVAFAALLILASCSERAIKSVKVETKDDSLAYAIGVANYQALSQDGFELKPAIIAKAMLEAADGKAMMDDMVARGFIMTYMQEKQEAESREMYKDGIADSEKFLEENKTREGVQVTESGLQYEVIVMGDGPMPVEENIVRVHYTGTLTDGTKFDSSVDRGEPAEFGLNGVIPGWTEGLKLMPVGSKFRFFIPSELGYGAGGAGDVIPPFSALVFEVELLAIVQ